LGIGRSEETATGDVSKGERSQVKENAFELTVWCCALDASTTPAILVLSGDLRLREFEPIRLHEVFQSDRSEHLDEGVQGYPLVSVAVAVAVCAWLMVEEGLAFIINVRSSGYVSAAIAELAYGLDVYFDHLICLIKAKKPASIEAGRI
jgi:hypothetical protein